VFTVTIFFEQFDLYYRVIQYNALYWIIIQYYRMDILRCTESFSRIIANSISHPIDCIICTV
jgi:hypothetical protein